MLHRIAAVKPEEMQAFAARHYSSACQHTQPINDEQLKQKTKKTQQQLQLLGEKMSVAITLGSVLAVKSFRTQPLRFLRHKDPSNIIQPSRTVKLPVLHSITKKNKQIKKR